MTKDRDSFWVGVNMLNGVRRPNNEEVRTLDEKVKFLEKIPGQEWLTTQELPEGLVAGLSENGSVSFHELVETKTFNDLKERHMEASCGMFGQLVGWLPVGE